MQRREVLRQDTDISDAGNMDLCNVGIPAQHHTESQPRRIRLEN